MPAIDLKNVQELLDLCDDSDLALFTELVEMFLRDAPHRIAEVLDGCARDDLEAVDRAAHALKGSAGNLGAVEVQHVADTLMVAGRAGDRATIGAACGQLRSRYAEAAIELRALLGRLTA